MIELFEVPNVGSLIEVDVLLTTTDGGRGRLGDKLARMRRSVESDSVLGIGPDDRLQTRLLQLVRHAVVKLSSDVDFTLGFLLVDGDEVGVVSRAGSRCMQALGGDDGTKANLPSLVHQPEV